MTRLEGLYAVTPDWADTARLRAVTEAILKGGCRLVQYRHKDTTPCHREEQAGALRELTRHYGARLIVNDSIELALAVEADGVHLGNEDGHLGAARERLGDGLILGASCYQSLHSARRAAAAGADYVAFGSFFPSPTKPEARHADTGLLRQAKAVLSVPLAAIGGITLDHAAELRAAGADLLAVISALYSSPDPERTSREFVTCLKRMPQA